MKRTIKTSVTVERVPFDGAVKETFGVAEQARFTGSVNAFKTPPATPGRPRKKEARPAKKRKGK